MQELQELEISYLAYSPGIYSFCFHYHTLCHPCAYQDLTEEALGLFSSVPVWRWIREWPTEVTLSLSHVAWTMDVQWALTRQPRLCMPRIEGGGVTTSPEFHKYVAAMRDGQNPFNRSRDKLRHVLETLAYLIALNSRAVAAGLLAAGYARPPPSGGSRAPSAAHSQRQSSGSKGFEGGAPQGQHSHSQHHEGSGGGHSVSSLEAPARVVRRLLTNLLIAQVE